MTMQEYTHYCTQEQTKRAFDLGAPLEKFDPDNSNGVVCKDGKPYAIPTTQQMINWLYAEKGIDARRIIVSKARAKGGYGEIEHAAIDAALNYLEKELCKTDFNTFKKHITILEKGGIK